VEDGSLVGRINDLEEVLYVEHVGVKQECEDLARNEADWAKSMWVTTSIEGVKIGETLVDQGCNRFLIVKSAFSRFQLSGRVMLDPVDRFVVITACGTRLPVTHRFVCRVELDNKSFNDRCLAYLVDDAKGKLVSDVIIGRAAIADSRYPYIDVKRATLFNRERPSWGEVQCVSRPTISNGSNTAETHSIGISLETGGGDDVWSLRTECEGKKPRNELKRALKLKDKAEIKPTYRVKIEQRKMDQTMRQLKRWEKIREQTSKRTHLDEETRLLLAHHIYTEGGYKVASVEKSDKHELTHALYSDPKEYAARRALEHYMATLPGSEQEELTFTELFNLIAAEGPGERIEVHSANEYVPPIVAKKAEVLEDPDEATKELNDIDTPFSAPTFRENTEEYKKEKREAIDKMVDEAKHVKKETKMKLRQILYDHLDRLSLRGENLKQTGTVTHEIDTAGDRQFRQR